MDSRDRFRLYERLRKQEYRAEKRRERKLLEAQIYYLEDQIKHNIPGPARAVKTDKTVSSTAASSRPWRDIARTSLHERTTAIDEQRKLQSVVQRQTKLVQLLHAWVSQSLAHPLGDGTCWRLSTLMADPVARQYGYEWLTDRVFHSAMRTQATDAVVIGQDVADRCCLRVHTDDACEILGLESRSQHTLLAESTDVVDSLWTESHMLVSIPGLKLKVTAVRDHSLVYVRLHNTRLGTSCCKLIRRYDLPASQGAVFVTVYIRDDESFPLEATERRPHGYGWAIVHNIAPGVALVRTSALQYAPVTTQGSVVSINETAAMFGAIAHATSRETTLARIENNALDAFAAGMRVQNANMLAHIQAKREGTVKGDGESQGRRQSLQAT
ncbi:Aste57867_16462 [Aphanomyces stellatus]|uniref:Aste57867_16462 protein n=1 Tax=Aphanomyces stellatus TaxID=120398 RepID=A0A485L6B2_9STRA|nr:hypothetical protein As57867_016405 [Aphanomyces stellatus]VFT93236.1 Aste57867_16462 [Aphanomyces stellatus]